MKPKVKPHAYHLKTIDSHTEGECTRICYEGFILLTNNNSCLDVFQNKELENFDYCEQLTMDNNKQLYCSKCS